MCSPDEFLALDGHPQWDLDEESSVSGCSIPPPHTPIKPGVRPQLASLAFRKEA